MEIGFSSGFKWVVLSIFAVAGFAASVVALDQHFMPREIHKMSMTQMHEQFENAVVQMQQQFIQMRKDQSIEAARQAVFYWMKMENALRIDCIKYPNNQELRVRLDHAVSELSKAQAHLARLTGQ